MIYFITFLVSYLLGSISFARITARQVKDIDITKVNSKNPGTSNIALTLGMKYAIIVGASDILKGLLPVLVIRLIYPENDILWFVAGTSAIFGHVYPVFMKFKGGKGTATFGGMVLAISPLFSILMAVLFTITLFKTKYMAIATLLVIVTYPLVYLFVYDFHYVSILLVSLYSLVSFIKHIPNFINIYHKKELKLDAVNSNKE